MLIVLSLLVIASILVSGTVAISQLTAIETYNCIEYEQTSYYAESAANTARWMLLQDRNNNPTRTIVLSPEKTATSETRWQTDARLHKIKIDEDIVADVQVLDPTGMINLIAGTRSKAYQYLINYYNLEDSNKRTILEDLMEKIQDYTDSDDNVRTNGMEYGDYEALGKYRLPRNANFKFKEELYWIPDVLTLFPSESKDGLHHGLIPMLPSNIMNSISFASPSFFSASKMLFRAALVSSSDSEIEYILEARKKHIAGEESIEDSLESTLLATIKQRFSFYESGWYYVIVKVRMGEGKPQRTFIFCCNGSALVTPIYSEWQML